ncbi:MAG: hypothetical protein COB51_00770 [Moraxellaceae bacterium]|nr:MAG: hypothetical protein COB51_00770 [Moraxellaceae bacterium]
MANKPHQLTGIHVNHPQCHRSISYWGSFLVLLCLWAGMAFSGLSYGAEKYYKWVDDKGVTHYTSSPPNSQKQTEIITTSSTQSSDAVKSKEKLKRTREALNLALEERKNAGILSPEEAKNLEIREKNCEIASTRLKNLQENVRLREKMENGEYKVITEDSRQTRISSTKKQVQDNCGAN